MALRNNSINPTVQSLSLLDLPPELWIPIGQLTINERTTYIFTTKAIDHETKQSMRTPAITRVCSVLRLELLPEFYKSQLKLFVPNWLRPEPLDQLRSWLHIIGADSRRQLKGLRYIHFEFECGTGFDIGRQLSDHWEFELELGEGRFPYVYPGLTGGGHAVDEDDCVHEVIFR